jgi:peptide deformylase
MASTFSARQYRTVEAFVEETLEVGTAMSREIHLHDDPCLTIPTLRIDHFGAEIKDYVDALTDAVMTCKGLAVAAPQIGQSVSMFAYRLPGEDKPTVVCNPKLSNGSQFMWAYKEGCLSFPGMFWWINRPKRVTLTYHDIEGVVRTVEAHDLKARMFQHEYDHLQGKLITSRITLSERKKAQRLLNGAR